MTPTLCAIVAATCLSGQLSALVPEAVATEVSGGPYCGVYCVYSAARMSGRNTTFEALLDNRYVGSWKGSTLAELRDAVASVGLTPTAMVGLTAASLKSCPHPVILHVRRPGRRMPYAHWVLYAGVQDGRARIVDPPADAEAVTFAELDAVWDGVVIVVSHEPVVASEIKASAWLESASVLLAVIPGLCFLRFLAPAIDRGRPLASATAACAVLSVGAVGGLAVNLLSSDGLFRDRAAAGQVAGQYFEVEIPEIGRAEAHELAAGPGVTFIDARSPSAYAAGHLPGAVNLPVFAGMSERRSAAENILKGNRVVVYCQSARCEWADAVAADLHYRGFEDVAVFRGGWHGWNHEE